MDYIKISNQNGELDIKSSAYTDWENIWTSTMGISNYRGKGIAIDSQGNILVASYYFWSGGGARGNLICFDKNGNYKWNSSWGNQYNQYVGDIAIDSHDNIYVAGVYTNESDIANAFVIKFDNNGNYLSNATWGGNSADVIYIDSMDNLYIGGKTQSFLFLSKYNSTLDLEWNKIYPGGDNTDNFIQDIVLDNEDNIYLVAHNQSHNLGRYFPFLGKYNSNGDPLWNTTWGGEVDEFSQGLVLDSQKNIYVAGYKGGYVPGEEANLTLNKFDNFGNPIWNKTWDNLMTDDWDKAYGIDIDSNDYLYICGVTEPINFKFNATLFKYNSSGSLLWMEEWGGLNDAFAEDITVHDVTDDIFTTGSIQFGTGEVYLFILKYIEYPPGEFTLSTDAESPDDDGLFTLTWNSSLRANNYSVYRSTTSCIFDIETEIPWMENLNNNSIEIGPISDGEYHYLIVAWNHLGYEISNCITVLVEIPVPPLPNGEPLIPGFNLVTLISSVVVIIHYLFIKKLNKKKLIIR